MKVELLNESGYEQAIKGMSLSYYDGKEPMDKWWEGQRDKAVKRARKLAFMGGGHGAFLEFIEVWIQIEAPLCFWKHMDRYRLSSQLSTSTMHCLKKQLPLNAGHFSKETSQEMIDAFNLSAEKDNSIDALASSLPDGFLQTRIKKMNYSSLQNVIKQRKGHRLSHWEVFISEIMSQVEHPELLVDLEVRC